MIINLPTKKGQHNTKPEIDLNQLVVIGANGSGKTRFGSKIEEEYHLITHRISAQKSLSMPKFVSPKSIEVAKNEFFVGGNHPLQKVIENLDFKKRSRWSDNFNTTLLNDYQSLLVLLHTEEYESLSESKEKNITPPKTKLDIVKEVWESVLPHRKLKITAGLIETYPSNQLDKKYHASEMSDGERVIFYLIAEVICAPENSIIIIDEPEMHLHKSLVKDLFNSIEILRPDCSFIYLTHDIDFAFSRQNATKIWAKSYETNDVWDYEILNNELPIPEQLYLEVLGSRNPVLFIEGDNSSIDYQLYEQVYKDNTLKPLGSCDKVIQTVKSFNEQNDFHHINSNGIIDRDRRTQDEIGRLNSKQIWVLDVAEAENLLLIEEIVKSVALHMGEDPESTFEKVKQNLLDYFESQLESQVLIHFREILRQEMLKASNFNENKIDKVILEVDAAVKTINKKEIFSRIKSDFKKIIETSDYVGILRVFNLKNALIPESKVCALTGLKNKESYLGLVLTLLKNKDETSRNIAESIDNNIIKNIK